MENIKLRVSVRGEWDRYWKGNRLNDRVMQTSCQKKSDKLYKKGSLEREMNLQKYGLKGMS